MDASRVAFGKISIQLEPCDLNTLLREVFQEQEPHARKAGVLMFGHNMECSCIVNVDRMRLRQIMDNLLSNAIKFTPAGGSVNLALTVKDDSVMVSIRDTGIGFDSAFAQRLFEPFVQHEREGDHFSGGLGLGLAIAARLVSLQSGTLSAASAGIGCGALFTLTLPFAPRFSTVGLEGGPIKRFSPTSVLVVDDDKDVADGTAELLRLHGVTVRVAYDGPSAVKSALEAIPDVVLCDLRLPGGMDGFAVARACRADSRLRNIRLVAASGYSSAEDHANARAAGFDSLAVKPLTEEALRRLTH